MKIKAFVYFSLALLSSANLACQSDINATANTVSYPPNTDTLPYPVVLNYDELAPIFQYRTDTTYVINFWATWCGPCVEELPYFEQLAKDLEGQPVKLIMVSLDFRKEIRGKLLRFVRERPLNLPVIAFNDPKSGEWISKVEADWGGAIPVTIIYKGENRVFVEDQFPDYATLREQVEIMMKN